MKRKNILYHTLFLLFSQVCIIFAASILFIIKEIHSDYGESSNSLILFFFIAAFVLFMVTDYYQIYLPIHNYKNLCNRFAKGEVYKDFIDQCGQLMPELSSVICRMDELLDRQNVIQLSTKQAEFLALQNQINPHFLYNTLEAIRGDALCAGLDNIADITEALSTFFRYTITETRNLVTFRDELENVDNYFVIQKYRFGDKLSLTTQINEDHDTILQLQCPKLFLQPIVENAIFHGLERKEGNGHIILQIEIIDNELQICVSDNGVGIPEVQLSELNHRLKRLSVGYILEDEKSGIALKNVCRRIKLLFGEQYGIHINSIEGIGTRVVITLPIVTKKNINED